MYTEYARAVDQPAKVSPVARPQPVPPPEARPSQLSVTDIENWLRDPYTIYAKHVLRLFPLEAIDTPPGAADRGTFIHESIGEFTKIFADALPADVALELKAIGKQHFEPLADYEEARAFWWTRFLRIADWFEGWERERRAGASKIFAEISGKHPIHSGAPSSSLPRAPTASNDAPMEVTPSSITRLDSPDGAAGAQGLAPATHPGNRDPAQGGFAEFPPARCLRLLCVRLKGGDPPGETKGINLVEGNPIAAPTLRCRNSPELRTGFWSKASPIVRSSTRCGKSTMAITTTPRASRNGRRRAAKASLSNESCRRSRTPPRRGRSRQPTPNARSLSLQCRFRKDPCCWCSA